MSLEACVRFARRLIRTKSLPGEEAEIAAVVEAEMEALGYDSARRDAAGNVIGLIRGAGTAPAIQFNTHLDHVDVGEISGWEIPPFEGRVVDGRLHGRGAMDIKGPLAAQVYGIARLKQEKIQPPSDVYVTAVVQEEVGGLGARHLAERLDTPVIVVGEASQNQLRNGHRGRAELLLHVRGSSVHASAPESGRNPLEAVARFISELQNLSMREHPQLGKSTVAPTLIRTDQTSANVTPGEIWLTCDWRNVAGESAQDAQRTLQELADRIAGDCECKVSIPHFRRVSYTGLEMEIPADNPAFLVQQDHPVLKHAAKVLRSATGLRAPVTPWRFATDGGHFAQAGKIVLGYGPGEEHLAHTNIESIALDQLQEAIEGNRALALQR